MTIARLARNQKVIRRPNNKGLTIFKREKAVLRIVEMSNSEICAAEFASWSIFDEDIGNDDFLGECMRLFRLWQHYFEEIEEESSEEEEEDSLWRGVTPWHGVWIGETEVDECCGCCQREEEEMDIEDEDDEEIDVEPESHDSLLMAALLSTKELLPVPSNGVIRSLSCPDLLMASLALLLFETRHLHNINERLSLPPPPKWMIAMESIREMDPPNSLVSTVSLPSGWDAVSARLSTSSIFNLFSDLVASPIPSLFSIDPTGAPSTGSTVSVPLSFWDTPSTVSMTGSIPPEDSIVSIPSSFFIPQESSASSSPSLFSIDPSGCSSSSSSSIYETISSSSSSLVFYCPLCKVYHDKEAADSISSDSSESSSEDSIKQPVRRYVSMLDTSSTSTCSCFGYSKDASGYETDVDSEPVLKKKRSTASIETLDKEIAVARMLAECDSMLEKIETMKKKLREMM